MKRTIDDLRTVLKETSAPAPNNHDRLVQVRRRIRRNARRRLAATASAFVAALAIAGVVVPRLHSAPSEPVTGGSGPLTSSRMDMARIVFRQYSATGTKMRIEFTPAGPDTAIVIQCRPGFWSYMTIGNGSSSGLCHGDSEFFGAKHVNSVTFHKGDFRSGKRVVLEAVIIPARNVNEMGDARGRPLVSPDRSGGKPVTLDQYLATKHPVGKSSWSVAIYSGTCKDAYCHLRHPGS